MKTMNFGNFIREKRVQNGKTLRSFCQRFGYDPAYISRLENNKLPPSLDDNKLAALAKALGIIPESKEWVDFHSLAYVAKQDLPKEIKNEKEIITFLPAYLRTPDNKKVDQDKLKKLIEFLKNERA